MRCLAITLVIASHTNFLKQGGLGNDIFFALSGFFAVSPFAHNTEKRFTNVKKIGSYYISRFFRIIPSLWFYLLFAAFLVGLYPIRDFRAENSLLKNMLFIHSSGHLWFLQQEVVFYIVVPFILLILYGIGRFTKKWILSETAIELIQAGILFVGAALAIKYLTVEIFSVHGNGYAQFFRLGFFQMGMATGYLCKAYDRAHIKWDRSILYRGLADIYVFFFIAFCILTAEPILSSFSERFSGFFIGWDRPTMCTALSCVAIFLLATSGNSLSNRFMGNRMFAYIGKISFSAYLFHWPFVQALSPGFPPFRRFIYAYFVTLCVAGVVYRYIEQPTASFRIEALWNKKQKSTIS